MTQSMDVTAAEAQLEKLKSIVMSKTTAPEPVKAVRAVKVRRGKTEREVSTAETLPASNKGSPKKKSVKASVVSTSHSSMGRTQSKWLSSLARQNYIYFSEKLIARENKARAKALRKMRMRLKTRFMLVFRLFRLKKYGVPLGPPLARKKLASPSKLKEVQLNVVQEEDEEHERTEKRIRNVSQIPESLCENIYEDIIYEFILLHADAIIRAQSFLLMVVHRRRFLKLRQASSVIQGRMKQYLARAQVKRLRQEKVDRERKLRMEKHLKLQQMQKDRA